MQYTVSEINDGVAKIEWSTGEYSFVTMTDDMTEADFDDLVFQSAPGSLKTGTTPSFVTAGMSRTAAKKPEEVIEPEEEESDPIPAWLAGRFAAYGNVLTQLEYITENGLDAWQTKVAQIKADNPKPSE